MNVYLFPHIPELPWKSQNLLEEIWFLKKIQKCLRQDLNHLPLGNQSGALDHLATQILDIKGRKVEFIKLFNNGLIWIYDNRSLLSYCTVLCRLGRGRGSNIAAFTLVKRRQRWGRGSKIDDIVYGSYTSSVASRARIQLTRSKCEWTRIWTI